MGSTPVHQRRCSTGLRSNEAPTSACLPYLHHPGRHRLASRLSLDSQSERAYTLSEIPGHVEGVQSPTLTSGPDNWYDEKLPVRPGRGKPWSYS
jgi:hypothetical protein